MGPQLLRKLRSAQMAMKGTRSLPNLAVRFHTSTLPTNMCPGLSSMINGMKTFKMRQTSTWKPHCAATSWKEFRNVHLYKNLLSNWIINGIFANRDMTYLKKAAIKRQVLK